MRLFVAKFSLPELEQPSPNRWRPESRYVSGGSPLKTRTWRHRKKSGRSECHFAIKKLAINANGKRAKSNFSFMGSTVCAMDSGTSRKTANIACAAGVER